MLVTAAEAEAYYVAIVVAGLASRIGRVKAQPIARSSHVQFVVSLAYRPWGSDCMWAQCCQGPPH